MRILRAIAKNFLSFHDLNWDFSNLDGISMIEGYNHDDQSASGSGKTALVDIISFVLFGDSPRKIKANEFVNDRANKGCVGQLHILMDNGQTLLIQRTRKPEDLFFQIGDNPPVRDVNIIKTQRLLEDLIKLDFNTFTNSVYFSQNAKMKFISAKDSDKRDILTRILDLSDFDKAYEIAKNKVKEVETLLKDKETKLKQNLSQLEIIEDDIKITTKKFNSFEDERQRDFENKAQEIVDQKDNIVNKTMVLEELRGKIIKLTEPAKTALPPTFKEEWEKEQEERELLERSKARLQDLNTAVVRITSNKEHIAKILENVQDSVDQTCRHCQQNVSEFHFEKQLVFYSKEIAKLDKQEVELQKEIIQSTDHVNMFSLLKEGREKEIKQRQDKEHEVKEQNQRIESENKHNQKLINVTLEQITFYRQQLGSINKDIQSIKQRTNGYDSIIQAKKNDSSRLNTAIIILQHTIAACTKNVEYLEILKKSYKNVKYYIFESTIDELNNRIDKYLEPLFQEDVRIEYKYISGKSNDKLKFTIKIVKNGINYSYEQLSDGEKKRAELATNFALSDIVSMRKANGLSLMILDEIMTGLPDEGVERVIELLEVLKEEKDTILIIDHFPATKALIENTIKVEKRDGISRICH